MFDAIWDRISNRTDLCYDVIGKKHLVKKINALFDYYKLDGEFTVVKGMGDYHLTPRYDNLFNYSFDERTTKPTYLTRTIYCVRNSECVIGRDWSDNVG